MLFGQLNFERRDSRQEKANWTVQLVPMMCSLSTSFQVQIGRLAGQEQFQNSEALHPWLVLMLPLHQFCSCDAGAVETTACFAFCCQFHRDTNLQVISPLLSKCIGHSDLFCSHYLLDKKDNSVILKCCQALCVNSPLPPAVIEAHSYANGFALFCYMVSSFLVYDCHKVLSIPTILGWQLPKLYFICFSPLVSQVKAE